MNACDNSFASTSAGWTTGSPLQMSRNTHIRKRRKTFSTKNIGNVFHSFSYRIEEKKQLIRLRCYCFTALSDARQRIGYQIPIRRCDAFNTSSKQQYRQRGHWSVWHEFFVRFVFSTAMIFWQMLWWLRDHAHRRAVRAHKNGYLWLTSDRIVMIDHKDELLAIRPLEEVARVQTT